MRTPAVGAMNGVVARAPGMILLLIAAALLAVSSPALAADGIRVLVSPDKAYAVPGGDVQFRAAVFDRDGAELNAELVWSVIPARLGVVSADGLFIAGDAAGKGIVRVAVTADGLAATGHATVTVGDAPSGRLSVVVSPPRIVLQPGSSAGFTASVTNPLTGGIVEADVAWSVVPAGLGAIDASGVFTAGPEQGAGRVVARATLGDTYGLGDAGVIVGAASDEGVRVEVRPQGATLSPGESVDFEASVTDAEGSEVDARVEWSAAPRRVGAIDGDGLFTAGSEEMSGRVVATVMTEAGPSRGFSAVDVRRAGGGALRIRVTPGEVALAPGGDAQFEAEVVDAEGEPVNVPVDWRAVPETIGTITATGLFTAHEEFPEAPVKGGWFGGVVASVETNAGSATDAARVAVRQFGPPIRLMIRPDRAVVAPGEEIRYETMVVGADDPAWSTEWAVFPDELGTITPDGVFVANPALGDPESAEFGPREGTVGARATLDDGTVLTDIANLSVNIPGRPVRIAVRPAYAVVAPLESIQFEAEVMGPEGAEAGVPVMWRVSPPGIGSVTPDGVFTAADVPIDAGAWQRPTGQVIAEFRPAAGRVYRGSAVVAIDLADPELIVKVAPKSASVYEGGSVQFTATVEDVAGAPVGLPVEWLVRDEVIGTIGPDGLFMASPEIPVGHSRRTTVVAGVTLGGRVYWDAATIRVEQ